MKNTISLTTIGPKLGQLFHRYGLLVFFLIIAGGLIAALITLNLIIAKTDDSEGYVSDVNNMSFDVETINKIRELRTDDQETKKIDLDSGRILPF
jgi:ABC-type bacteriocin/lantibiotic exporter with double-glycine peptidase domain